MSAPAESIPARLLRTKKAAPALLGCRTLDGLRVRHFLLITALYWGYVVLSNILYAENFSLSLATHDIEGLFAPWHQRLMQHVLLFPMLLGCYWLSLRVGWQPMWRALPKQIALAVGFAMQPNWLMMVAGMLMKLAAGADASQLWPTDDPGKEHKIEDAGVFLASWLASGTNFLVQYGFGLALLTGFAMYQRFRDAELQVAALQRESNAARLAALRMQLSPHTLFNLLNTIRGQIGWDPRAAQQLVVQLSELLRRLLNAGEREFALLADELQFVRLYLELQQSRFSDRLTVTLPSDQAVPAVWVPSLILQPLIENAVVHGLAGHDGPVQITLSYSIDDEALTLRLTNTVAKAHATPDGGIGLRNVRERLQVHFGARATLRSEPASRDRWISEIVLPVVRDQ
ncbi:MAG TPA: histidine kinase [Steroidobacteraceae bacterium]|nr:histidine kinase [Steroidobacteraceae bacterium]HRX89757.1 histidine kinase [Steroidobacteraceae bacterium]